MGYYECADDELYNEFISWMDNPIVERIFRRECPDIKDDEITYLLEIHGDDAMNHALVNSGRDDSDWDLFISYLEYVATPEHLEEYRADGYGD